MHVEVRKLKAGDIKPAMSLVRQAMGASWASCAGSDMLESLKKKKFCPLLEHYVASTGSGVVGVVGIYTQPTDPKDICWVSWTSVDKKVRRHGVGAALLEKVIAEARRKKMRLLCVWTPSHLCASGFYERFGFEEMGRIKGYFKDSDMIYMAKRL